MLPFYPDPSNNPKETGIQTKQWNSDFTGLERDVSFGFLFTYNNVNPKKVSTLNRALKLKLGLLPAVPLFKQSLCNFTKPKNTKYSGKNVKKRIYYQLNNDKCPFHAL